MPRTLSARELNRALLARQGLLERRELALPEALDAMGALQAQYAPSMYIGLWSRVAGFERDALTRALERREVVQATLMRVTIHLVSRADYWPLAVAIRDARRAWFQRVTKQDALEAQARTLREALREGPMKRKAIEELIGKESFQGIGMWVDMVRVPPSGTWERRRADLFGLAEDWLGAPEITLDDALDHLVTRYLTGFGPASQPEIANWGGLAKGDVEPVLSRLELVRSRPRTAPSCSTSPQRPCRTPTRPRRCASSAPGTPRCSPTRAARRSCPRSTASKVFHTKMPQSIGTYLVDGAVAGTWKPDGTLTAFDGEPSRDVHEEFGRLMAFCA